MTWFKVDDGFHDHPKVFDAPDCAVALWLRCGSWAARNLTDGFVPARLPARLCDDPDTAVKELLDRGLWVKAKGGYQFHDWHDYQPSKSEVLAAREKKSSGGKIGNHRRWHVDRGVIDPACPYCDHPPGSDNRSHNRSDPDRKDRQATESLPNRPSRPDPARPADTHLPVSADSYGSQSVHARARVREGLAWLRTTYGLTDEEAATAWEVVRTRAKTHIDRPVDYLQSMSRNGSLFSIIEALQHDTPAPAPSATENPDPPPEPPSLRALPGKAASNGPTQTPMLQALPGGADEPEPPLYDHESGIDHRTAAPLLEELRRKWRTGS